VTTGGDQAGESLLNKERGLRPLSLF